MTGSWKIDPTSWRTAPRPKGWNSKIRPYIKRRDNNRCTWIEGLPDGGSWTMWADPKRCPLPGTEVDHMGAADDHALEMLRLLCTGHHKHRSQEQAAQARSAQAQQHA